MLLLQAGKLHAGHDDEKYKLKLEPAWKLTSIMHPIFVKNL